MAYLIDPLLKSARKLAEYAQTRDKCLKDDVLRIIKDSDGTSSFVPVISHGPFQSVKQAEESIIEAGKAIYKMNLAKSVFGNISTVFDDIIYISSTGSQLDSLENSISCCDMEGGVLNGISPSSELSSHLKIFKETRSKCVLHAHPFFTIVYTLIKGEGSTMFGVPIVGGEVGGGENGIVHTVPPVLKDFNIVAVHAHGVFSVDAFDFNAPIRNIIKLEQLCKKRYIEKYL